MTILFLINSCGVNKLSMYLLCIVIMPSKTYYFKMQHFFDGSWGFLIFLLPHPVVPSLPFFLAVGILRFEGTDLGEEVEWSVADFPKRCLSPASYNNYHQTGKKRCGRLRCFAFRVDNLTQMTTTMANCIFDLLALSRLVAFPVLAVASVKALGWKETRENNRLENEALNHERLNMVAEAAKFHSLSSSSQRSQKGDSRITPSTLGWEKIWAVAAQSG